MLYYLKSYFPDLVSYNRFVELIPSSIAFLFAFLEFITATNRSCGFAFVDSAKLPVCKNSRIHSHKIFKGLTEIRKDPVGWSYSFKLHLIVNERGIQFIAKTKEKHGWEDYEVINYSDNKVS